MDRTLIETIEHDSGLTSEIHVDEDPQSPRDWDNLGKLLLFERGYSTLNELGSSRWHSSDFDELVKTLEEDYHGCLWLPVYKYEHGNVQYSTGDFHDPWDSGLVGLILAKREDIMKEYSCKVRVSAKVKAQVYELLRNEVSTYSQYCNGEVYGYIVKDDDEELDSCWGFFGSDYCEESAKEAADYTAKDLKPKEERERIRQAQLERIEIEQAGQMRLAV
jgi:hypothetical protein